MGKNKLDWTKLFCKRRPCMDVASEKGKKPESNLVRNEFAQDYGRVVFSPPFRRLSKKTQVHPFSNIDFIHNRLTHSVEVSSLGQTFGLSLARFLKKKGELPKEENAQIDIVNVLCAACLAHDIGNPPFGHAGEDAIKAWAEKTNWNELGAADPTDWLHYDGNAQAFRMASNPEPRDSSYFRLTYATCGSLVKYPWVMGGGTSDKKDKAGCFRFDEARFDVIMTELGLKNGSGEYLRHPLSYLLEAADDICYQVMDVEDAVTMRIVSEQAMKKILAKVTGENPETHPIQHLRGNAIHKLCECAFETFTKNYDMIMQGMFSGSLTDSEDFKLKRAFGELHNEYKQIFSERSKVMAEVACYEIMDKLLTRYAKFALNLCTAKSLKNVRSADMKLLEFTWGRPYVETAIKNHSGDIMWWLHAITDHIVGMTDDYARTTAAMF